MRKYVRFISSLALLYCAAFLLVHLLFFISSEVLYWIIQIVSFGAITIALIKGNLKIFTGNSK